MSFPRLCLLLALTAVTRLTGDTTRLVSDWDVVRVDPVRTSIYVGSVGLTMSDFQRQGDSYVATYDASVRPWFWWNEHGRISIRLSASDIERLGHGGRVDFTGEATNHKNKLRHISGWAEKHSPASGKIKVRIGVDDTELIFNSTYRFVNALR